MTIERLPKAPTGIAGLDEITHGGLPKGRPTLVAGNPGCGKTLLALEFLIRGALHYGEPGVFVAFEETAADLAKNVASLGYDLKDLIRRKKLAVEYIHIERGEIAETGEYDLEGLFIRIDYAAKTVGAKRVAIDTLESLFAGLPNHAVLRAELRRLFRWLKDRKLTTVITGERGDGASITRQGLDEYVSDCVVLLDHRVTEDIATRRLRVIKYRGSIHGTNEYPFLIGDEGISVLPITALSLNHKASRERVSSGVPRLDEMLGGRGFYRGSSVLMSGTAGTGKSTLAATFAAASAARGERCLYLAFEESPDQIVRNMIGIGVDLRAAVAKGLIRFVASRPSLCGLESHLAEVHRHMEDFKPRNVVVDPITNFMGVGSAGEVQAMLSRLVDFMKTRQITALFTSLTHREALEVSSVGVSSVMDTWIQLRDIELSGERNRLIYVLKARGMKHSNQVREFLITSRGIRLVDVYLGNDQVLTGSARASQGERERL
ncbi:MAG: circadian clock protein KaiC, partial [Elusimicrobia bacterium]|nr:circadian clock protein KaiC [Elusimicrobiota bacterium]